MPIRKPEEQVLIVAPVGQDATAMASVLLDQGFEGRICDEVGEACRRILPQAGALVLTEEALELPRGEHLLEVLKNQPSWSELPLIILTRGGETRVAMVLDLAARAAGSVTLLERPISSGTLLRSVEVALRSRRRQYQVRDLLEEERRRKHELEVANAQAKQELVERKYAERALARRAREQTALYEFTDRLQRAGSLSEIYQSALDSIFLALGCNRASILLFDDSGVMRFVAWRGLSDQYRAAVEGHSPWGPDESEPKPISVEAVELAEFPTAIREKLDSEGVKALAFIPIVASGKLLGKFMAYYDTVHHFIPGELDLALTLARQIGFGLERKRVQQDLAESEERYRTLVEQVKDYAIFRIDKSGRPTSWNEGVRRVLGFEEKQFIGQDVSGIFTSEDIEAGVPQRELRRATEAGAASNDRWMRRADGTRFYATGVTTRLRNKAGELIGYSKVLRDSTALMRAQQKLKAHAVDLERTVAARTKDLQAMNEQLEAFVYSIAHDLRAPLRAIMGYSQLLQDDHAAHLQAAAQTLLKRMQSSSEFMDKLLLDLLAFGRTARAEMELGPVDVKKAWEAAVFQCAGQIEQSQAQVDALPPLPVVIAHEATLGQCLANLLSNALKFMPENARPRVRFWAEDRNHAARLWVEDNGLGIPPEQRERVFRVFERLHGARFPGTGIGLSIVRKGVERMGGNVGVKSEQGNGSRFWIELPKAA
jgi:PAS domain S-box-containing protein